MKVSMRQLRQRVRIACLALSVAVIGAAPPIKTVAAGPAQDTDAVIAQWRHPTDGVTMTARGLTRAEPVPGAGGSWRIELPPLEWTKPDQQRVRVAGASLLIQPIDAERARLSFKLPQTIAIL